MSHHHHQHHQQQQHHYHEAITSSWYPEPASVATTTGAHLIQNQQLYNTTAAGGTIMSPNSDSVIGASVTALASSALTRPDMITPLQPQQQQEQSSNNYYQASYPDQPASNIYQCQQDYYNSHRPIEPFQQAGPPAAIHGWGSSLAAASAATTGQTDQSSSPQVVGNIDPQHHHHLHMSQGLMEQSSNSSSLYPATGAQTTTNTSNPVPPVSYTNDYSHQSYQQQNSGNQQASNHHAIASLQHSQEDTYANQCHNRHPDSHHHQQHPNLHHHHHHLPHSQSNPADLSISASYNPANEHAHHLHHHHHHNQRGSSAILMHSGAQPTTLNRHNLMEPIQGTGNDHNVASQLYSITSRTAINPQHYQQKQGLSIVRGHIVNSTRPAVPNPTPNLPIQQQVNCGISLVSPKTTQSVIPSLTPMASSGSGSTVGQICRKQSSSVISTSSVGSNSSDHQSPTDSPLSCLANQTIKLEAVSVERITNNNNNLNRKETSNLKLESEHDESKESQLSQLHQQCAVLLDEQQQINSSIINSPRNSNTNVTNASNSGISNDIATDNDTNNSTSNGNSTVRCKRLRTSFKHNQLKEMKKWFSKNQNPDAKDLKTLAQATGLSKRVLQVWFQNSRAKFRRNNPKVANQQIYGVNHTQHVPHLLQYQQQHQQANHQQPAVVYHNHDRSGVPPPM